MTASSLTRALRVFSGRAEVRTGAGQLATRTGFMLIGLRLHRTHKLMLIVGRAQNSRTSQHTQAHTPSRLNGWPRMSRKLSTVKSSAVLLNRRSPRRCERERGFSISSLMRVTRVVVREREDMRRAKTPTPPALLRKQD